MTKRNRRLLVFALFASLFATGVGGWLLRPRTAITRENAVKILPGMTLEEVEAILGGPMRDDSTGRLEEDSTGEFVGRLIIWSWMPPPQKQDDGGMNEWRSDYVSILVTLDANGRILECFAVPVRRAQEGPIGMIRHWLPL